MPGQPTYDKPRAVKWGHVKSVVLSGELRKLRDDLARVRVLQDRVLRVVHDKDTRTHILTGGH